ncbi:flagellar export protein FliJ [Reinekea marina]|uniref:Flagellar FliJ protein n=1 Tax=Reinekea marina TaxID=1310421 RepID=A0ABV7WMB3_9GAMM|nr:flagellar export protein FliJ [Reinekea marina]MDN3649364.1 flagellar export protein FliJ [Reinekea marina]
MKRSERLKVIETLAKQREDQAAAALGQIRAQVEAEEGRYKELESYRAEYLGYLDGQGGQGISIEQWRRTQGFIDQLGDLMVRQQNAVAQWKEREDQVLQKWQALYQKRKNIAKFIEGISIEEVIAADKQEQQAIDELVSMRYGQEGP